MIMKTPSLAAVLLVCGGSACAAMDFSPVDTGQTNCYDTNGIVAPAVPGAAFAGQDAQYSGATPAYVLGTNGLTVYDQNTGLTWTRSPDWDGDGTIDAADKFSQADAVAFAATLNSQNYGGFSDWRLPSIKELYSLMDFRGVDISGNDTTNLPPFIDVDYFAFGYGDTNAGERLIDAQFATTTLYVDVVMNGQTAMFGLNLADGRIKGYPVVGKNYYVYFVRGNPNYGANDFLDNGDGTVTDRATGLMWQQADSGAGLNWPAALAYAENLPLAGWQDWRLPNAKELQTLVDYARAPGTTASAAIDPVFSCTAITNEAGQPDFPWYWTSTTHVNSSLKPGNHAAYVCFGRALGYFMGAWRDVHGAGCQRSDPKDGSLSEWTYAPSGYYNSIAPQGDAIRIFNFVRCVRAGATPPASDSDGDGIPDWTEYDYATNATGMNATGDLDGDGFPNLSEIRAGTSPANGASLLALVSVVADSPSHPVVSWQSALGKTYALRCSTNLAGDAFSSVLASGLSATPPLNVCTAAAPAGSPLFFRVAAE